MLSSSRRIFNEYFPVKAISGNITVKLKLSFGISALNGTGNQTNQSSLLLLIIYCARETSINRNYLHIHLSFSTTNWLGPLTINELNLAWNSGPRRKLILSKANGSSGGVVKPSPKSPVANFGRNLSTSRKMQSSGLGRFREHAVIVDAETKTK